MPKPETTRPLALVYPRAPFAPDDNLTSALRDDLTELLQFLRLRVQDASDAAAAAKAIASHEGPGIVCFSDVAGVPPDCIEGALEMVEDLDVMVGPTADGDVYLLAFSENMHPDGAEALINAATGENGLSACITLCEQAELSTAALPPWFRIGKEKDLSFAEQLTRLSLLNEDGDMDFFADRLRLWFENRSKQ